MSYVLSCSSAVAVDELGCRYTVCSQRGPQETQTWRTGLPQRGHSHYCWHEHGTVTFKSSYGVFMSHFIVHRLTQDFDVSFLEEGLLQGHAQRHRRRRTHKLHQCAWKRGSARRPRPQPHAVRLSFTLFSVTLLTWKLARVSFSSHIRRMHPCLHAAWLWQCF